jgi:hypothetical protein
VTSVRLGLTAEERHVRAVKAGDVVSKVGIDVVTVLVVVGAIAILAYGGYSFFAHVLHLLGAWW